MINDNRKKQFLNDLYLFYRYFIASNYTDSVPAPHIKILSRKLMELKEGKGKHRLAVSMPPRHPLKDTTPIYTSNRGWITHGEIKVGDKVVTPNYTTSEVIKVYPKVYVDNCFEFSNGDRIISGDEHLWKFHDEETNTVKLYTTNDAMKKPLYKGNSYIANLKIPLNSKYISLIKKYKVNPVKGNCISIDSKDGMYMVGRNWTPTHNSKSSMVTLAFPLWLLFQNPNVNIMIVTGSPKLAEKFGIQLREYVRDLGKYFNVYLSNVKQASTHIMFCDKNNKLYKGNIMLASSGGGITGQDADYLILDDPYTGNDSEFTPSALQQKIDWVNRVVEQRIEPHTKYPIENNCPVYTSNRGWTTHGNLKVGDKVITPNYTTATVIAVHPKVLVDNVFEFSNGDRIISGDDHLWKFHEEKTNTTRLFTTKEIMEKPLYYGNSYLANHKIPFHSKCISLIRKYKTNKVEGNCITIDKKDGMYLVGRNWTPTHNCILHTRWHSNDLIGYYKENDPESYDFVEFSAIKDNGKPLWGERYTIDDLLKKKEVVGERVFQSVYQQHPIDTTSDYFNMQHLKYGEPENFVAEASVRGWDIASSDALSNNDFTAGVLMERFGDFAVIQDLVHGRFGGQNKKIIQSTAESDTPSVHICIETGVAGAGNLLYEEWCNQLRGFMVSQAVVSGGGSKVDRATPLQNAIEDGKVYINLTDPVLRDVFYKEFQQFPNGKHDDIVDATAHCFNSLFMEGSIRRRPRAKLGIVYL